MTKDEQQQLTTLQDQLDTAHQDTEKARSHMMFALDQSHNEARFYQAIFWCALVIAALVVMFGLLRK
jgi:t-SNARE complex subunit (syntaxin)